MKSKTTWIFTIFILGLFLVGWFILRTLEWMIPSFPGLFFGQLQLTRNSTSLPPKAYQSAEFILGQVNNPEIIKASYIYLQEDVLFWDPYYPGFPRTELSREEVQQFQEFLGSGQLIEQDYPDFVCLDTSPGGSSHYVPCEEGSALWDQFNDYRFQGQRDREVGALLIELTGGRIVEIRISPGEGGLAFEPTEKAGPWWFDGLVNEPFPLLEELAARAEVEPIEVLWPQLTTDGAHAKAKRILGKRYRRALDVVLEADQVKEAFGEIGEIRPAVGINTHSSWMDSSSCTLTFYVAGTKGTGAVLVQGEDCFSLDMVVEGKPIHSKYDLYCQ